MKKPTGTGIAWESHHGGSLPQGVSMAIWTDFGGVLTPPVMETFTAFCREMEVDPGMLMKAVLAVTAQFNTDDIMEPIDTPLVSEEEWLARISRVLLKEYRIDKRLTTLADAWFDKRETNHAWVQRILELKDRGLFVGLISNMVPAWDAHWRRMVPVSRLFDSVILSFEAGCRKPSPGIFQLAAARSSAAAQRCVLVDDSERNCAGARACGWQAIHFTGTATAWVALEELLVRASREASP